MKSIFVKLQNFNLQCLRAAEDDRPNWSLPRRCFSTRKGLIWAFKTLFLCGYSGEGCSLPRSMEFTKVELDNHNQHTIPGHIVA